MPRVPAEHEHETLTGCQYNFPDETLNDVRNVRATYRDLRMYVDFYCYPNKERKKLIYLAGTIPVTFDGNAYNIPIRIWLHETHPTSRPRCYVCPSVSMVINPRCPCVDTSGHVTLAYLSNWRSGQSTLPLLVTEMRMAFQKETPLYATQPASSQTPATPTHGAWVEQPEPHAQCVSDGSRHHPSGCSSQKNRQSSLQAAGERASATSLKCSQLELVRETRVRRSYTEDLLGIDFSTPGVPLPHSSSNPFLAGATAINATSSASENMSNLFKSLQLERVANMYKLGTREQGTEHVLHQADGDETLNEQPSPLHERKQHRAQILVPAGIHPDKAAMFRTLLALEGRSFNPADVLEAVQSNRDLPSALKYLSHDCPICRDQVSFSKITTMTHCSCAFCESCFKAYFSATIKERSIEHLVCPLCSQPDVSGQGRTEESMDYFSLLDTQIRHYLDPQTHELFQRKLRDRTLQEMPNFRWCAHCSFGLLHEVNRLRMDCPSCGKSTCSQCKTAWAPQHEGLSCEKFRQWQLHNNPEYQAQRLENLLSKNKIECPKCKYVFYLSKGGCLHYKCTQCQHEFCGGCNRPFKLGSACDFSTECGAKGLHAHHPRDCLYHLRDWNVARLHKLLQHYRVSPPWQLTTNGSSAETNLRGVCSVLELREPGSRKEEPCGRPALPGYSGHCELHYKERLVELINRSQADPVVLFDTAEIVAELQRWHVAVPPRKRQEPEALYTHRLRQMLAQKIHLRNTVSPVKVKDDVCPLTSSSSSPMTSIWAAAQSNPARGLPQDLQLLLLLND